MSTPSTILAQGGIRHGLAGSGDLRWAQTDLTQAVETVRRRLDLSPLAAVALGQLLAGTVLIQRLVTKTPLRLRLEVRGDGPLGRLQAEVDADGHLRGSVDHGRAESPDGSLGIAPGIGHGLLRVVRQTARGNYESQVELVPSGIGQTLTHYLEQSEQIRAAVLLGVMARPEGITAAGGMVLEALPDADGDLLLALEERIAEQESVSRLLESQDDDALLDDVLGQLDRETLASDTLSYACSCDRDSLLQRLRELPVEDLEYLEQKGGDGTEVVCTYCGARYLFPADELRPVQ